jgi:hypothetical protein
MRHMSQLDRPVRLLNIFSVAPDHVLSCVESVGALCYLSRLVYGHPTFFSGDFSKFPEFPKQNWESRKHQQQNGVVKQATYKNKSA